jgi:NitT/TauT family transport system ATP-binding protein
MSVATELIRLENASLSYEDHGATVDALSRISLSVSEGESVALLGPTGCGKSSLLFLAAGLLFPNTGDVFYRDAELTHPHREIGLVLQDYGLFPWKTVRANVELGLKIRGEAIDSGTLNTLMTELGIQDQGRKYPHQLSGGQKQRVALARALILNPHLLLLDEPFAALDTLTRERLQDLTAELWKSRQFSSILVTHNVQEAVRLGQRILIMDGPPGKIVGEIENSSAMQDGQRGSDEFYAVAREVRSCLEQLV